MLQQQVQLLLTEVVRQLLVLLDLLVLQVLKVTLVQLVELEELAAEEMALHESALLGCDIPRKQFAPAPEVHPLDESGILCGGGFFLRVVGKGQRALEFLKRCGESLFEHLPAIRRSGRQCGIERADGGGRQQDGKSRKNKGAPDSAGQDF